MYDFKEMFMAERSVIFCVFHNSIKHEINSRVST